MKKNKLRNYFLAIVVLLMITVASVSSFFLFAQGESVTSFAKLQDVLQPGMLQGEARDVIEQQLGFEAYISTCIMTGLPNGEGGPLSLESYHHPSSDDVLIIEWMAEDGTEFRLNNFSLWSPDESNRKLPEDKVERCKILISLMNEARRMKKGTLLIIDLS